ncbi:MAG TPA: TlpA disulfide reductase family protein [Zeimonas sp.]|nr:TlpA disulfide reductase family protein [Zeimonas sp.]
MNRRHWLALGVAALSFGGLGAWVASRRYALGDADSAAVALLHGLTLPDAAGQPMSLAALRGQPTVVNFWATWCPPCVEEMPELSGLAAEFRERGVRIVGIGIDSAPNIRQFSEKTPVSYPLLVAGTSGLELVRRLGNTAGALPFTIVVAPDGRVAWRTLGRFKAPELRAAILRTL